MKSRLSFVVSTVASFAMAFALYACGDSSTDSKENKDDSDIESSQSSEEDDIPSYDSEEDLPSCTQKKEGTLGKVGDDYVLCTAKKWVPISGVVADEEELPNCTEKKDGQKFYSTEDEGLYTCVDGDWEFNIEIEEDDDEDPDDEKDKDEDENDEEEEDSEESSSSSRIRSSSSAWGDDSYLYSSNSNNWFTPENCGSRSDLWSGCAGEYQVNTGLDNGTETSGYWEVIDSDNKDGGQSTVTWPVAKGNEYDDKALDPIIDNCQGVCGSFYLNRGTISYDPFVSIGFNVAGTATKDGGEPTQADASSWGGICLTYKWTESVGSAKATLELGIGSEGDRSLANDNPFVTLSSTISAHTVCRAWSDFHQAGWGTNEGGMAMSGAEAAKTLAQVRIKFQGTDGNSGNFNIISVGTYPFSGTYSSRFETWKGDQMAYFVYTGLDNGTETAGYWWEFSDAKDSGRSTITWPVAQGNEYDDYAMDPIIDYCQGVCGSFSLSMGGISYDPYVGVGFNVAGTATRNGGEPTQADASSWGGLCLTYMVTTRATLELGIGNEGDKDLAYDNPYTDLYPATSAVTVYRTWSDFKQAGWGTYEGGKTMSGDEAAATLASIKFKIQGKDGTTGAFNIQSIGPLGETCGPTGGSLSNWR